MFRGQFCWKGTKNLMKYVKLFYGFEVMNFSIAPLTLMTPYVAKYFKKDPKLLKENVTEWKKFFR